MAAAGVLQSPRNLDKMASQRAALRDLPNATNSPVRYTSSKRARAEIHNPFEDAHARPSKRQLVDRDSVVQDRENVPPQPHTPQKRKVVSTLEARLAKQAQPQFIERERPARHAIGREKIKDSVEDDEHREKQRANEHRQDDISRWQKYYQKQFPHFRFYFENISEDVRKQCSRQVQHLGSRDENFFSRSVTHVITTRTIPHEGTGIYDDQQANTGEEAAHRSGTINPSLLDRRNRAIDELAGGRSKYNFEAALNRKAGLGVSPEKGGRATAAKGDVLVKAKNWGIKIWQLEKLQRILRVMFAEDDSIDPVEQEHYRASRSRKQTNLSQLIKNEERHLTSARELGPMQGELITLTEPYIFVRCYNEKTKPLMVRQYQKVADHKDGDWPQFRPVTQGKCPFILEEPRRKSTEKAEAATRKEEKVEQRAVRGQAAVEEPQVKRSLKRKFEAREERNEGLSPYESPDVGVDVAKTTMEDERAEHDDQHEDDLSGGHQDEVAEHTTRGNNEAEDATTDTPHITPPLTTESAVVGMKPDADFFRMHSRHNSFDLMAPPAALPRPNPRLGAPGGEPVASGLQKSGMTSAIRSQIISSNAGTTGTKAGTSRDLHSLQRRILERNSTGSGSALGMSAPANTASTLSSRPGLIHSRGMLDIAGRARAENPRAAKTKAVEKLIAHGRGGDLRVDADGQEAGERRMADRQERQRVKLKRDPKPGYCENCREKFDDFDTHTKSRKHRKFAADRTNWLELDDLLAKLQRPMKEKRREQENSEGYNTESDDSTATQQMMPEH